MSRISIPGHISRIPREDEARLADLFRRFGNARRRAYNLLRKGCPKPEIEKLLQPEQGLNSRYVKDALHSVKDLPAGWTCGGLRNQRLREKGRISMEEYRMRRNSLVVSRGDKTDNILHEVAGRIINIAKHYRARIVLGKLNTGNYRGWGARKIKGIPHRKLFHILGYKYSDVKRCSEAYTSKIADSTKGMFGYDVHKVSASLFALKILDYDSFSSLKNAILKGVRADEGGGSPSARLTLGSEVTPLPQARGLVHDEDAGVARNGGYSAIPGSGGVSPYMESMRNNLPCLQVKIC